MTEDEKKLLQAKHRLEEAQARNDVAELLNEPKPDKKPRSVRKCLQEMQAEVEQRERATAKKREKEWER